MHPQQPYQPPQQYRPPYQGQPYPTQQHPTYTQQQWPPAPGRPRKPTRWPWILAGVVVFLILVGALSGGKTSNTGTSSSGLPTVASVPAGLTSTQAAQPAPPPAPAPAPAKSAGPATTF